MQHRRAIVIAVDGLRASALGAYGNTWHPTPALDHLASESIVVETMWREAPDLSDFYRSAWGGGELQRRLAAAGITFRLITDDEAVAQHEDAGPQADRWFVAAENVEPSTAHAVGDSAMARLFAAAADAVASDRAATAEGPFLVWVHAQGFFGPWDAPPELRGELLDEGDPDAPTFVLPPRRIETTDHDELLAFRAAYAAQVMTLDHCVAALMGAIEEGQAESSSLIVLTGCRGYALGEHGAVGGDCSDLYSAVLHIPCLLRATGMDPAPPRRGGLATPTDLAATLAAWFGVADEGGVLAGEDLLTSTASTRAEVVSEGPEGQTSVLTENWFLRTRSAPLEQAGELLELYAKPDDRWDANEVADRCPDEVGELLALLGDAVQHDHSRP